MPYEGPEPTNPFSQSEEPEVRGVLPEVSRMTLRNSLTLKDVKTAKMNVSTLFFRMSNELDMSNFAGKKPH